MTNPGWDLQKAAYQALKADAALTSLLGVNSLYDDIPQNADFPYVVIDQMRINDWSTSTERGSEHILMLHVWSRNRGKHEVHQIADGLRNALHDAALTLDDNRLINLTHQYSDLKRDEDGKTWHGVIRFRAVTEPVI
jgi:hypothetical protein